MPGKDLIVVISGEQREGQSAVESFCSLWRILNYDKFLYHPTRSSSRTCTKGTLPDIFINLTIVTSRVKIYY